MRLAAGWAARHPWTSRCSKRCTQGLTLGDCFPPPHADLQGGILAIDISPASPSVVATAGGDATVKVGTSS